MDEESVQKAVHSAWPQLVEFLSCHPEWVLEKAKQLLPQVDLSKLEAVADDRKISLALDMFKRNAVADASIFKEFMQSVCMECSLPMELEIVCMCASGLGEGHVTPVQEVFEETATLFPSTSTRPERRRPWTSLSTINNGKQSKQQRLDSSEKYRQRIITAMLQRYGANRPVEAAEDEIWKSAFSQTFINLVIRQSKPWKIKSKAKEGPITLHDSEEHSDTTLGLSDLFKSACSGTTEVILLLGKPGMGKTRLMNKLCQQWAEGTLEQYKLIFLFEFWQLNLINRRLSLQELLFDFFLCPEDCPNAVFEHLLDNAQHVLMIFDGLDEFVGDIKLPSSPNSSGPDPFTPLAVSELFASLCHGNLLPSCTVLVTTRPKMLPNILLKTVTLQAEIWGFDHEKVEEYASSFFQHNALKDQAIACLKSNGKLLSMCYIPALCNIVCICLEYLLLQDVGSIQLPQTMTQFYIKMVLIFMGKFQKLSGASEEADLSQHRATLESLCELAFKGLEEKKMSFYAGEVPAHVRDFASLYGLLLAFEIKASNGNAQAGYTFVHFSFQEFFAALFLLTSKTIDDNCLRAKFFLRPKWILKKEAKMTFTENCHIFLSGLSSQWCRQFLSSLAGQNESWIQERQAIITQILKQLAVTSLTGPKVVELCHCVYETQDLDTAQHVGTALNFKYQFRNFRLMPLDITSLVFVIGSSPNLVSLGFVGCPMELEYLDVLASCENIESLSFQSRKYGNEFAAALSKSLPKIKCMTTFKLAGGNITVSGLEDLLQAFANCHQLEDISLQDNKMKEQEMMKIIEIFSTVEKLKRIDLSHNQISENTVLAFCEAAAVSPNVTELHIRKNTLTINFTGQSIRSGRSQSLGINEDETVPRGQSLILRLQDCRLSPQHATQIARILRSCSHLSEIDLSGNNLGDEGCRELVKKLSKISITGLMNLNNNQLSLKSIFCLLHSMTICPNIETLEASLHQKTAVLTLDNRVVARSSRSRSYSLNDDQFSTDKGQILATSRKICLTGNCFHGEDLKNLCLALRCCSVTELDLSDNSLGDAGVLKVAELLPDMKALRSLILDQNHISLNGVFCLAQSFSALDQMTSIHLNLGNTQSVWLSFGDRSRCNLTDEHQSKLLVCPQHSIHARRFSLKDCVLAPEDVVRLFGILNTCSGLSEINFFGNTLNDESIEQLLKFLPHLQSLKLLSIRNNMVSRHCVCLLASSFNLCERICEVEVRSSENAFLYFVDGQESREVHCRLIDCGIGQDDIKELCVILEKSGCLVELDLSRNCLGNDGLRCLLEHLPGIHTSCLIKMSHNGISQDGVLYLVNALATCPNVTEVHISLCSEETLTITLVRENNLQKTLRLKQCSFQPEQLATVLGKCFSLTDFTSVNNGLTLRDAEALFKAPRKPTGVLRMGIEELWVKNESLLGLLKLAAEVHGNITEVTIRRNASLFVVEQEFPPPVKKVESVVSRLRQCELEAKGVPFLQKLIEKCQQLCALNWSEVQFTDTEAATISSALLHFPALKRLELTCCRISPFGFKLMAEALSQCHAIEEINLSKCNFGTKDLSNLVDALEGKLRLKSINLGFLNLENGGALKLISRLSALPLLRRLVLNNNSLHSEVYPHLAETLRNAIHMEEINLSYNEIKDAGVKEIATAVPEMKNLKQINLSHNSISCLGGQCFVEALASSERLEELRLSENDLGCETVVKLAAILPSVHHLKVLHLSSCNIDFEGISHLARALSECPQIQELSLSQNFIGDKGVQALAEGMAKSSQLRRIELKMCGITDSAYKPLASGLSCCALLEEIVLSWNLLGDKSTLELAKILPGMERLRILDLDHNKITDCSIRGLAEELTHCRRIQSVRLWHNEISAVMKRTLSKEEPRLHFSA
ncbi:protein NLRC5 [Heteronotia binoei]|uniref:protein NLRC5 n=1 Tax=Heteronotia binoei TaxID=13085 RepID=UPI0029307DAA|nr:protein NLRC5 [Heteronotia binoei]